jgi:hypothetical protein
VGWSALSAKVTCAVRLEAKQRQSTNRRTERNGLRRIQ